MAYPVTELIPGNSNLDFYKCKWLKMTWKPTKNLDYYSAFSTLLEAIVWYEPDGVQTPLGNWTETDFDKIRPRALKYMSGDRLINNGISIFVRNPLFVDGVSTDGKTYSYNALLRQMPWCNGSINIQFPGYNFMFRRSEKGSSNQENITMVGTLSGKFVSYGKVL